MMIDSVLNRLHRLSPESASSFDYASICEDIRLIFLNVQSVLNVLNEELINSEVTLVTQLNNREAHHHTDVAELFQSPQAVLFALSGYTESAIRDVEELIEFAYGYKE